MEKRYADAAIFYAAAAMVFGVFYREFTKFNGFTGKTNLSVMHTHSVVAEDQKKDGLRKKVTRK